MKMLVIFVVLSLINVIMSTIKSVLTVKSSKGVATLANAIYYSFYTLVVKQLASVDYVTAFVVTLICNLIGVYLGFVIMELFKKDKVWRITVTLKNEQEYLKCIENLKKYNISFSYVTQTKAIDIYSYNQRESSIIKNILNNYNHKYFIQEMEKKL